MPVIGAKERKSMKKKIVYTDEPLGEVEVVEDFLPPPEKLVLKKERVKVTMELSKSSIDYFKRQASKQGTAYQVMMRNLLDYYVAKQQGFNDKAGTKRV